LLPSFSLLGSSSRASFTIHSYGDDNNTDEILLSFDDNESFVGGNDNRSGVDVDISANSDSNANNNNFGFISGNAGDDANDNSNDSS